jgi:hypothetical protein
MSQPKWPAGPFEVVGCNGPSGPLEMVRVSPVGNCQGIVHVMPNEYLPFDYLAFAQLIATAPKLAEFIESMLTKIRNDTWTESDVAEGYMILDEAKGIPFPGKDTKDTTNSKG